MDERELREQIPAYVLGALDEDERAGLERHLADCVECQAELRAYREAVGALSLAVAQKEPPVGLKGSIIQQAAVRMQQPVDSNQPAESGSRVTTPGGQGEDRTHSARGEAAAGGVLGWLVGLVRPLAKPGFVVATLVVILALLLSNLLLWRQMQALQVAQGTKPVVFELRPTGEAPSAGGVLIVHAGGQHATLIVDSMPVLSDDQQYQLWLVKGEQRSSGGVFSVWDNGYGYLQVEQHGGALVDYDSFGITIEPYGGSPGPTGPRILASES